MREAWYVGQCSAYLLPAPPQDVWEDTPGMEGGDGGGGREGGGGEGEREGEEGGREKRGG